VVWEVTDANYKAKRREAGMKSNPGAKGREVA